MMGDVKLFFSSLSPLLQLSPFKKKKKKAVFVQLLPRSLSVHSLKFNSVLEVSLQSNYFDLWLLGLTFLFRLTYTIWAALFL